MGYNNTQLLTMCYEGMGSPSTCDHAYAYIKAYREAEAIPANVTPWYLPSIMCWDTVAKNLSVINRCLKNVNGDEMTSVESGTNSADGDTGTFFRVKNYRREFFARKPQA